MKTIECNHCDETVILPDNASEEVERGETPLEHLERTGHSPRSPETRKCDGCGNVWPYTGNAERPTCPNCSGKQTESVS